MTNIQWYDPLLVASRDSGGKIDVNKIAGLISIGANIHARDWMKNTALHYFAEGDNEEAIVALLAQGADINSTNAEGKTVLYVALESGACNVALSLIDRKAIVSTKCTYQQLTALHLAAQCGNLNIVTKLLDRGARVDVLSREKITPLMAACEYGHWPVAELLMLRGSSISRKDVCGRLPLHFACMSGELECVRKILAYDASALTVVTPSGYWREYSGWDVTAFAAYSGNIRTLEYLLALLSSVKPAAKLLCGALSVAAMYRHQEMVQWLLNKVECPKAMLDEAGILCDAIASRDRNVVETVLEHGVDVNAMIYDKRPPIIYAVIYNSADLVDLLLSRGASVDLPDCDGWTALFHAVVQKNVECVRLLLQRGADPYRKCRRRSVLQRAQLSAEYSEVLECILEFLAEKKDK